ncbi:metallophosphoesterase [Olivibacter jilunii]|uniref:metallophosphoesterase n=1 Tax=Olivibacter jilunii TaxID=985016 RepID=UPI0010320E4C|nr:metallophosphoesterase [Olivibacter jilunii]
MSSRTYVIGDIHGGFKALNQCLQRADIDYKNDTVIQLGDVVDGYGEVFECVEELLKIKNLIAIKGNHDEWFNEFLQTDFHPGFWNYGGKGTIISYLKHTQKNGVYFPTNTGFKTSLTSSDIPASHKKFFRKQRPFFIDRNKRCFVHGGFDRSLPFRKQEANVYCWDRNLWLDAVAWKESNGGENDFKIRTNFSDIFIGHTPLTHWGCDKPSTILNITNLDTGAGHSGRLTIMDVESKEFWQSDSMDTLYPENFRD